jgi:hypothetical protein
MAKNTTAYFLANQNYTLINFTSADSTSIKDLVSASTEDSWVYEVFITSTEGSQVPITIYLSDGSNDVPIKSLLSTAGVAANQGTSTSAPNPYRLIQAVDNNNIFVRYLDRDQNYYVLLPNGWKLRAKMNSALTSGTMTFMIMKRDF